MTLWFMVFVAYGSLVFSVDAMFNQERSSDISNRQLASLDGREIEQDESWPPKEELDSEDQLRKRCLDLRDAMRRFSVMSRRVISPMHAVWLYHHLQCSRFEEKTKKD